MSGPALIFILLLHSITGGQYLINTEPDAGTTLDDCQLFISDDCENLHPGGLVITLDDQAHLESWWQHRADFNSLGLRLTMFIDRTDGLNDTEWTWLQTFQSDGHEIGLHGSTHENVNEHLEAGGTVDSFIDTQVRPELDAFSEHGISPTAYAYPDGQRTLESDVALLDIFHIVRSTNHWSGNSNLDDTYSRFDNRVVKGHSMDREYSPLNQVSDLLERAVIEDGVVITYSHRLDSEQNPYHTTNPADLFAIASEAKLLGLEFLTISEIAQPNHEEGLEHMLEFLRDGQISTADKILENCWILPRFAETCFSGSTPEWNEDPYDENYWRFVFYSLRPLRHLLHAWEETGESKYRDHLVELVIDFSEQDDASPWVYDHVADKHGAAFRGLMLTEIRWSLAHDLALTADEANLLDSLIMKTRDFLSEESNFEDDDNHGFTEAAALLVIAANHPRSSGSSGAMSLALNRLDLMMSNVVGEDGVLIENSPYYHLYILNKVGEIHRWGTNNQIRMPTILSERLPKMIDYAVHVAHPDLTIPLLGAALPGYGIDSNNFAVFEEEYPELSWLRSSGERGQAPVMVDRYFSSAKQLTWRSSWHSPPQDSAHLLFDIGPYRTEHSDYDALTLTWWAGRPIIVDPGLYSYESGTQRDFFHGSGAHNALIVDGGDQAAGVPIGIGVPTFGEGLGWTAYFSTHILDDAWVGRWVIAIGNHTLLVIDQANDTIPHDYELLWHLSAEIQTEANSTGWDLLDAEAVIGRVRTLSSHEFTSSSIRGQMEPMQGWVVDGYESMIPASTLSLNANSEEWMIATLFTRGDAESNISGTIGQDSADLTITTPAGVATIGVANLQSVTNLNSGATLSYLTWQ